MNTGWYGKRIRNWVGSTIGTNSDTACYRLTEPFNSRKTCPAGYTKNGNTSLAQCPLAYPVKCFLECIPQNDDCTLEITQKTVAVVASIVNVVTAEDDSTSRSSRRDARSGVSYLWIYPWQFATAWVSRPDELTIQWCGYDDRGGYREASYYHGDEILSSAQNVYKLLQNASVVNSTHSSVDTLQGLMDTNSTCGYQLKRLTDHVILSVNNVRNNSPDATVDDIRVKISKSSLVLKDIPAASNNCMNELLSYKTQKAVFKTRDLLRKTFGVIVDQLIETATTDLGKSVAEQQNMLEVTNMGLTMLAGLDPTRIVWLASQFVQPTCAPTAFIGEIDDGSLYDALGLTTTDEAFVGSYGTWKKKGDGIVNFVFTSSDTKDVTVVIHSGGENVAEVDVNAGATRLGIRPSQNCRTRCCTWIDGDQICLGYLVRVEDR